MTEPVISLKGYEPPPKKTPPLVKQPVGKGLPVMIRTLNTLRRPK